jgi:hypothetical protein
MSELLNIQAKLADTDEMIVQDPEKGRIIMLGSIPSHHEDIKVGEDGTTKNVLEPCPVRGKEAMATRATCACGLEYVREGEGEPLVHPDDGMIKVTYYTPPSKAVAYALTMVVRGDGPRQIWDEVRLEFRPDGTATRNGIAVSIESALKDLANPLRNANFGKKEQARASAEQSSFELL